MSLLSESLRNKIDEWAQRYPAEQRRSAMLQALMFAQEENQGYLSNELIEAVAAHLGSPSIAAYEVATFYSMYNLTPIGKHKIDVCTNISCMLVGADEIISHLKKRLKIDLGETTSDGRFTLKEVECLGSCAAAPVCQISKRNYEQLTPTRIDEILEALGKDTHE